MNSYDGAMLAYSGDTRSFVWDKKRLMLLQNVSTTETRFLCVNKPNVIFSDRYG